MASGPDLFVVCKSCGSEVSPYITECPYCGTRLRKRAPKLERGGTPKPPRRARPRLAPLRAGEIPGIRPDRRPYATIALVVASVVISLLGLVGVSLIADDRSGSGRPRCRPGASWSSAAPLDGEWWRLVTTQFLYSATGYEVAALAAIALFGTLLERRHGWWAPLLLFVVGGGAGHGAGRRARRGRRSRSAATRAALAMLAAWSMRDILGRRAGREDDADLLGVLAIAVLLVLLPLATEEANSLAGLGGGVAGIVIGLVLARLR